MEAGELKGKQCALTLKMPVCLVSADKKKQKTYKHAYMTIFREFISQSHYFRKIIRFIIYKTKFINEINISNTFY